MLSEENLVKYIETLEDVSEKQIDHSEDQGAKKIQRVFYRGEKIFVVIEVDTKPLRIEIRCDRRLSKTLQERFESVMESRALGRNGIEIICSGQLPEDEIIDLVRHAYEVSL